MDKMKKILISERQNNLLKRRVLVETVSEFDMGCKPDKVNSIQQVKGCLMSSTKNVKTGKNKKNVTNAISNIDKISSTESMGNIVKIYKYLYRGKYNFKQPYKAIETVVYTINSLFNILPGDEFKRSEVVLGKLIEHLSWSENVKLSKEKIDSVLRSLQCYMFGVRGKNREKCTKVNRGDEESFIKNLNDIRFKEYSNYEDSFQNYGFNVVRSMPRITSEESKVLLSYEDLKSITDEQSLEEISNKVYQHITSHIDSYLGDDSPRKYDIVYGKDGFPNEVKHNNDIIIKHNDHIEVKKIPYKKSSYLSEFLAIGKQSDIALEFGTNSTLLRNYNYVISSLFNKIKEHEDSFINYLVGGTDGMFFDDYIYTPIDNIKFELKAEGQRGEKEKRLSLWYEIINTDNVFMLKSKDNNVWFE